MDDKELFKNFREIRKSLQNLNKMVTIILNGLFEFSDLEDGGNLERDIKDVQPKTRDNQLKYVGYLG